MQVRIAHHIRVVFLLADGETHPARAVRRASHLFQDLAGQLPELPDIMRNLDTFLIGRAPERVLGMRAAEPMHLLAIPVVIDTQEMQGEGEWYIPEQSPEQIDAAVIDEAINRLGDQGAHHRLVFTRSE